MFLFTSEIEKIRVGVLKKFSVFLLTDKERKLMKLLLNSVIDGLINFHTIISWKGEGRIQITTILY